jgi:putative exosortase-associated protein (TIGR04073 family)
MKKMSSIIVAALFLFAAVPAFAADAPKELVDGMGAKAFRGGVNTLTGWVEIPMQISKGYEKDSFIGGFVGIFTGVWHAAGRTISGAFELAGFWSADLESNDGMGVSLDAEYAWEKGEKASLTDPSVEKATLNPMGMKLMRGIGNTVCGVAELPGQILKAVHTPATEIKIPDAGIVKGLWYMVSREIVGAGDLATFYMPGPVDTKAMKFDEKWPWSALGTELQVKG